jgi:hypothetical protein
MALRNSQVVVEVLETASDPQLRNSQVVVEVLETASDPQLRNSQVAVEVFGEIVTQYNFFGDDDDPPDSASWIVLEGTPTIQGNRLELLADSVTTEERVKHKKKIAGNFQIVLNFKITDAASVIDDYEFGLRLEISGTEYLQFSFGHDGIKYLYVRYANGGGENVTEISMHGTVISKMVVKKEGNTLRCWYLDTQNGYLELGSGYTVGLADDEFSIFLFAETSDDEPDAGFLLDHFAVLQGYLVNPAPKVMSVNIIT